ncbi:MAG: DUF2256 domain-containing protein [Haliscomenobacter sp.]|nr:DUF2256 domain-containing protein [Haliscomenobacter sp.]
MSPRGKKSTLPSKICPVCGWPFLWRKKWEKQWDLVAYCSNRCRKLKKTQNPMRHGEPKPPQ